MSEHIKTGNCGHLSDNWTCLECHEAERDYWKSLAMKAKEILEVVQCRVRWKDYGPVIDRILAAFPTEEK